MRNIRREVAEAAADASGYLPPRDGSRRPPTIQFQRCYLVVCADRPLFVEPMLSGEYTKWNSNHGAVHKMAHVDHVPQVHSNGAVAVQ